MTTKQIAMRAHRVLAAAMRMAEKVPGWETRSRIEEMQLHEANDYYTSKSGLIATGDWNTVNTYNRETKEREEISDLPKRVGNIFEKMGIECEWSDCASTCSDCGKLLRTEPDSYSWQPDFWVGDGEILCRECIDPVRYLEVLEGNASACAQIEDIDPADYGYVKVNDDSYESGWHPGQTDDPAKVAAELEAKGVKRFLFRKDEQSQFYSRWSVYVHEDEEHKINGEDAETEVQS